MQRQILVPLDGSALAETVLPHAVRLAYATHSSLLLLRVVPIPALVDPLSGAIPASSGAYDSWEADSAEARAYLGGVIERLQDEHLTIRTDVIEGDPATAIVAYARARAEGLMLAMATHGRSGLGRWVFGSVAERVLHATPVPLLLVRPPAPGLPVQVELAAPYRQILVPLDGSEVAEQALDPARQLAVALDATLLLAGVVPVRDDRAAAAGGVAAPHLSAAQHEDSARLDHYLKTTAAGLTTGGLRVETQVLYGHPAEALLRDAEYSDADLLVMATHGRSGLQQLWLGSVALKVVQGTRRPVLLVRAQAVVERAKEPVAAAAGRVPILPLTVG
jgi:nucleotide-binding universal stress UspA family protein